jgi:dolichol-phosphate mannosyltransferase
MKPLVCIVLPTYNEAENISILLPWIFKQTAKITTHDLHVLVVDDNSPDGTGDVVKNFMKEFSNLHLLTGGKKGLGAAYKRGISHAIEKLKVEIIFEMDADLQHNPDMIPIFINLYNQGFSLVIGSRFLPGAEMIDMSLYRKFLSLFGNWLIRFFGGLPRLRDLTSGYRCIDARLIKKCDFSKLSTTGYAFQTSLIFELLRNGAKVIEVPINFPERRHGVSKLSFPDQLEFLVNLIKIRFQESYEFIRFLIIGSLGVFVNLGIYIILTRIFSLRLEIAALIAIEISILSNFFFNNLWVIRGFESKKSIIIKFLSFQALVSLGGFINFFILIILANLLGLYDIIANVIGIIVGILTNYSLNSFLDWRRIKGSKVF